MSARPMPLKIQSIWGGSPLVETRCEEREVAAKKDTKGGDRVHRCVSIAIAEAAPLSQSWKNTNAPVINRLERGCRSGSDGGQTGLD